MDWWKHYLNGEICRRLDTPMGITSTMEDWFDGAESAMRKFVAHQPVTPSKLLAEVEYCMTQNTLGAKETKPSYRSAGVGPSRSRPC
jgi:hypothetical protein